MALCNSRHLKNGPVAVLCFRKQQLISALHPRHMALCLALHLREELVCGISYFILIMAGYPWQPSSQWELHFLRVKVKMEKRVGCQDMSSKAVSLHFHPLLADCVVSSEGCGTPGEWIITCQTCRRTSSIIQSWDSTGQSRLSAETTDLGLQLRASLTKLVRNHVASNVTNGQF